MINKTIVRLLPVLLPVLLLGACASKSTAVKPEPLKKIAEPEVSGQRLWSAKVGGRADLPGLRPIVTAERIYAGSPDGVITVLDANGQDVLRVRTREAFTAGPGAVDGKLLFGTRDGQLIAYSAGDAVELWRVDLSSEVLNAPIAVNGVVVARSGDGRLYGLALADGERLWTQERVVPALVLRGSSPLLSDGDAVYLGLDNGRVLAVSLTSGETLWEEVVSLPTGRSEVERLVDVDADLLLIDGILFATSYGGDLVAVRADTGAVLWRRTMKAYTGLDFDGNCLYVTDVDSVLWCLDPANGGAFWKQEQLRHRRLSAPVAYKGNVVVADFEGYLHFISAAEGRIVGRSRPQDKAVRVAPLVRDGRLFVLDVKGRLSVVDGQAIALSAAN